MELSRINCVVIKITPVNAAIKTANGQLTTRRPKKEPEKRDDSGKKYDSQ